MEQFPYDLIVELERLDEVCQDYVVENSGTFWKDNVEYVCLTVISKISKPKKKREKEENVEN